MSARAHAFIVAAAAAAAALAQPAPASACGGLFCNSSQPVNQAAERILFAYDGEQIHMHIRITYQGPPTEFGWILPVPAAPVPGDPGVQAELSTEELFTQLDLLYAPRFQTRTVFPDDCDPLEMPMAAVGGAEMDDSARERDVQVHSREAVGPYDRAILSADNVQVLRAWLDENGFDIPEAIDEKLGPYVTAGRVFVVLKLLPDAGSGDIAPLRVSFLSDAAAIPIRPTAVAANNDMGVIVHVLDDRRAIPTNYRHVEINEAAINWLSGGQNYADVVSQAVDEAGGHAFATDYAGDTAALQGLVAPIPANILDAVRAAQAQTAVLAAFANVSDADVARVLDSELDLPADINAATYMQCPPCLEGQVPDAPVDGADIAARLVDEINTPREQLAPFLRRTYLTRMYTTLSPAEMDQDPEFAFNADLPAVPNVRIADLHVDCDFTQRRIVTPSGLSVPIESGALPDVIRREDGVTVQGAAMRAAALVSALSTSGPPTVIDDRRPQIEEEFRAKQDGGGCACRAVGAQAGVGAWWTAVRVWLRR